MRVSWAAHGLDREMVTRRVHLHLRDEVGRMHASRVGCFDRVHFSPLPIPPSSQLTRLCKRKPARVAHFGAPTWHPCLTRRGCGGSINIYKYHLYLPWLSLKRRTAVTSFSIPPYTESLASTFLSPFRHCSRSSHLGQTLSVSLSVCLYILPPRRPYRKKVKGAPHCQPCIPYLLSSAP